MAATDSSRTTGGSGPSAAGHMSLTEVVGGPARRTVILLLASVLGLQAADTAAIGALAAPLERSFHIGNTDIGLLVTVTTLIGCIATLPFGNLSDRYSRTAQLQIVVLLWAVATAASALSVSYVMLLVTRLALGGVIAAAGPAIASLVGDLFPGDERGRLYGFVLAGELIGAGIGILLAGGLSSVGSWRLAIGVLAMPAAFLAWALRRWLPEPARGGMGHLDVGADHIITEEEAVESAEEEGETFVLDDAPLVERLAEKVVHEPPAEIVLDSDEDLDFRGAVRYVLRLRTNVALIISSGLGYFFLGGLETFAELYFRERFGVDQAMASLLFILVAVGALAGVLVSGRVADHLIERRRPNARMLVAALAYAATAVCFVPGALAPALWASLPIFLVAAFFLGATNPPANAARLDIMPSSLWGRAEAVRTVLQQFLQGLAPFVFGVVSEALGGGASGGFGAGVNTSGSKLSASGAHGLELAFVLMAVPLLLAGVSLWLSRNGYLRDVVAARRSDEAQAERLAEANP